MNLEITTEEHSLLSDLLVSRIGELHPEIRHCMNHEFKDKLRHELKCLESLRDRLTASGSAND